MDQADRLHSVLESTAERLAGVLEGARFERWDGYSFIAFPTFPIRDINGVWAHTDAAAAYLEDALAEAEELGESVYRRLGFRDVETYEALTRPPKGSQSS